MDLATVFGLVAALASILLSVLIEGGKLSGFINIPAALLVIGGTFGATAVGLPLKDIMAAPNVLRQAFFTKSVDPLEVMRTLVEFSRKARREGILALENDIRNIKIPFLQRGIQLVVDGTSPDLVGEILDTELASMQARHKIGISVFDGLGGFAPTLGILGTVMGLVNMLANLDKPGEMGGAIASAFIATLYGVGSANLLFLPVANKLKARSAEETRAYELAIQGILSLQAGENPRVISAKMQSFLSPKLRELANKKGTN
jgi:chemotaxis protein MotA